MKTWTTGTLWPDSLRDPSGCRQSKPRTSGKTMVIDKGLGLHAFADLLESAGAHIDMIKIGFGTAPLYPIPILRRKIELAHEHGIIVYPGGTFLEIATVQGAVDAFFETALSLGFTGIEVSDGTIELPMATRRGLILRGVEEGLSVFTEYGKKCWGSAIEVDELIETVASDTECGAEMVTIEARESGVGVGIFDASGNCRDDELEKVLTAVPNPRALLWEAPLKDQQVRLLSELGPEINIGNVPPYEAVALEAMRRGLRSDTLFQMRDWKERSRKEACESTSLPV